MGAIRRVPKGSVATYGQVARMAGFPGRARWAGWVLRNTRDEDLPWHRIINARGESSFPAGSPARAEQLQRLEEEGVEVSGGRVDLRRFAYDPVDELLWGPSQD